MPKHLDHPLVAGCGIGANHACVDISKQFGFNLLFDVNMIDSWALLATGQAGVWAEYDNFLFKFCSQLAYILWFGMASSPLCSHYVTNFFSHKHDNFYYDHCLIFWSSSQNLAALNFVSLLSVGEVE